MDEKDLVEGMREYISLLQKEGRYSSAKSYQDAMNSFIRYSGTDRIPYTYINKDTLRRYEAYLLEKGCMRNTVSTYIRRLRCIYNKAVENGKAEFIPTLFKGIFTASALLQRAATARFRKNRRKIFHKVMGAGLLVFTNQ